ncbi:MAG: hypothetical protein ACRDVL_05415 [Acidimicrobiia bacterium]
MLTKRFEILFARLSDAFVRYDDTPRSAETVVVLAAARARLEDSRHAIRLERRHILQSVSPKRLSGQPGTKVSPVFSLNHER